MDLQKRSDSLLKARKSLTNKTVTDKLHKDGKFSAYDLMGMIFDDGTFVETNAYVKAYANELGTNDTSEYEGVVCGYGAVDGRLTFAYAQDLSRVNGAFSKAASYKIAALYEMALKNGAPVIACFNSNGAKIEEGIDVLSGYGTVMKKVASARGKVPQIAVICGLTSGAGATIASMYDIIVMSQGATFSQAPVSALVNSGASDGIAGADYSAKNGNVSVVTATVSEAFASVKEILSFLPSNRLDKNVYTGVSDDPNRLTPEIQNILANQGYDVHAVISSIVDGGVFTELYSYKAKSVVTCFATINGIVCGIIANNPSNKDGVLCTGSLRKMTSFAKLCDTFGISIVNLVDTCGFSAKCEAEGGKISLEASNLANVYCTATVPVITVNTGNAYGTAFTILGSKSLGADVVIALDSAKIGVLNPSASVAMMWTEKLLGAKAPIEKRKALEEEWENLMSTPLMAAYSGQIDDIIPASDLRVKIASALEMLSMKNDFINL